MGRPRHLIIHWNGWGEQGEGGAVGPGLRGSADPIRHLRSPRGRFHRRGRPVPCFLAFLSVIILPRILPRAAGHLFTYAQAELLTRHQQPGPYQRSACSVGEERDPACHKELSSHPGGNTNPAASPCCASLPVPLLQTDVRSAARSCYLV